MPHGFWMQSVQKCTLIFVLIFQFIFSSVFHATVFAQPLPPPSQPLIIEDQEGPEEPGDENDGVADEKSAPNIILQGHPGSNLKADPGTSTTAQTHPTVAPQAKLATIQTPSSIRRVFILWRKPDLKDKFAFGTLNADILKGHYPSLEIIFDRSEEACIALSARTGMPCGIFVKAVWHEGCKEFAENPEKVHEHLPLKKGQSVDYSFRRDTEISQGKDWDDARTTFTKLDRSTQEINANRFGQWIEWPHMLSSVGVGVATFAAIHLIIRALALGHKAMAVGLRDIFGEQAALDKVLSYDGQMMALKSTKESEIQIQNLEEAKELELQKLTSNKLNFMAYGAKKIKKAQAAVKKLLALEKKVTKLTGEIQEALDVAATSETATVTSNGMRQHLNKTLEFLREKGILFLAKGKRAYLLVRVRWLRRALAEMQIHFKGIEKALGKAESLKLDQEKKLISDLQVTYQMIDDGLSWERLTELWKAQRIALDGAVDAIRGTINESAPSLFDFVHDANMKASPAAVSNYVLSQAKTTMEAFINALQDSIRFKDETERGLFTVFSGSQEIQSSVARLAKQGEELEQALSEYSAAVETTGRNPELQDALKEAREEALSQSTGQVPLTKEIPVEPSVKSSSKKFGRSFPDDGDADYEKKLQEFLDSKYKDARDKLVNKLKAKPQELWKYDDKIYKAFIRMIEDKGILTKVQIKDALRVAKRIAAQKVQAAKASSLLSTTGLNYNDAKAKATYQAFENFISQQYESKRDALELAWDAAEREMVSPQIRPQLMQEFQEARAVEREQDVAREKYELEQERQRSERKMARQAVREKELNSSRDMIDQLLAGFDPGTTDPDQVRIIFERIVRDRQLIVSSEELTQALKTIGTKREHILQITQTINQQMTALEETVINGKGSKGWFESIASKIEKFTSPVTGFLRNIFGEIAEGFWNWSQGVNARFPTVNKAVGAFMEAMGPGYLAYQLWDHWSPIDKAFTSGEAHELNTLHRFYEIARCFAIDLDQTQYNNGEGDKVCLNKEAIAETSRYSSAPGEFPLSEFNPNIARVIPRYRDDSKELRQYVQDFFTKY